MPESKLDGCIRHTLDVIGKHSKTDLALFSRIFLAFNPSAKIITTWTNKIEVTLGLEVAKVETIADKKYTWKILDPLDLANDNMSALYCGSMPEEFELKTIGRYKIIKKQNCPPILVKIPINFLIKEIVIPQTERAGTILAYLRSIGKKDIDDEGNNNKHYMVDFSNSRYMHGESSDYQFIMEALGTSNVYTASKDYGDMKACEEGRNMYMWNCSGN